MAPSVSWLIPVKNGMPYLPETLASIEAQTYRDFEVLVWDNGSTDGTVEELRRWIPHRLPGRVVSDQPRGLSASRAALVELSQAEFCAPLDADDITYPDRLELEMAYLHEHPEVAMVGAQYRMIDSSGLEVGYKCALPLSHEGIVAALLQECVMIQSTLLFRRNAILAAGNYRQAPEELWGRNGSLNGVEDYELFLRLASTHRLANLPKILVNYRFHAQSITRQAERANRQIGQLNEVFIQNASNLFGWDMKTAEKFRSRSLGFLFSAALRMARYRAARENCTAKEILHRPDIIDGLQHSLAWWDVISGLTLATLDRRPDSFARFYQKAYARRAHWILVKLGIRRGP